MDNEFILQDRIQKIQQIIRKYDENNFYISYSGGQDSNVLSALIDLSLPDNNIPRVYVNTGIEYKAISDFVKAKAEKDSRFIIITPAVPIKKMLDEKGYPFKSKFHSRVVDIYSRKGISNRSVRNYLKQNPEVTTYYNESTCPKILLYQFDADSEIDFKISDKCCFELKEKPLHEYEKQASKPISIIGIVAAEGGRRAMTTKFNNRGGCILFKNSKVKTFKPLYPITKEWEEWFIEKYKIELPILYYPPYSFKRTGCKGCPFAANLQHELDVMEAYLPKEKKQCEYIWAPVYAEYRRIGYRLRHVDENQLSFFDSKKENKE